MKPILSKIHVQTKKRALAMADYLAEYGIEVLGVIIKEDGNSTIDCVGDHDKLRDIINQFNEDYGDY